MTQKSLGEILGSIEAGPNNLSEAHGLPPIDRAGRGVPSGVAAGVADDAPTEDLIHGSDDEPPICSTVDAGEDQDLRDGILPDRGSALPGGEHGATLVREPPEHVLDAMVIALRCHGEFGTTAETSRRNAEKAARDVWKVISSIPEDTIVGKATVPSRTAMENVVIEGILVGALADIAGIRVPREVRPPAEVASDALAMVANLREG